MIGAATVGRTSPPPQEGNTITHKARMHKDATRSIFIANPLPEDPNGMSLVQTHTVYRKQPSAGRGNPEESSTGFDSTDPESLRLDSALLIRAWRDRFTRRPSMARDKTAQKATTSDLSREVVPMPQLSNSRQLTVTWTEWLCRPEPLTVILCSPAPAVEGTAISTLALPPDVMT